MEKDLGHGEGHNSAVAGCNTGKCMGPGLYAVSYEREVQLQCLGHALWDPWG